MTCGQLRASNQSKKAGACGSGPRASADLACPVSLISPHDRSGSHRQPAPLLTAKQPVWLVYSCGKEQMNGKSTPEDECQSRTGSTCVPERTVKDVAEVEKSSERGRAARARGRLESIFQLSLERLG